MKSVRFLLTVVILGWLLTLSSGETGGSQPTQPPEILVVCPEGPPACRFEKIEDAVQAAGPNDLISLRPGTYQETLTIEKSVRLVAAEGGQVYIQGAQANDQPTITLKSQDELHVLLEGVIIKQGIRVSDQSIGSLTFTLVDSQITQSQQGFACSQTLHSQGSARFTVLNSRFSENDFGIYLDGCDFREMSLTLSQSTFLGNSAGVFVTQAGSSGRITIDVAESRFVAGGGLTAHLNQDVSKLTVRNSWFLSNIVGLYSVAGMIEIRDSRFIGNRTGVQLGHPIASQKGFILLEDSIIADNIERGLYIVSSGQIEVRNSLIQGNGIGVLALRADNQPLWLGNNRILDNREWGVALVRSPCVENPPSDPRFIWPIYIQGENNEIHGNGKGDLCPEDYNWPPDFIKKP